ncbi:MAG: TRAP transporter small permease [Ferrovibrio sp.]|jgi:TRAP-type C4-dicarboxylate transport system permease small subunit|uniref:TRAP transporter small permease n=1 Tax=Ferrovibrio sp. TaxID=1917215 RepID=UPI00391BA6E4
MAQKPTDASAQAKAAGIRPPSLFDRFCTLLAVTGGFILMAAATVTVVSVLGRYFLNAPIPGDIEIVGLLMAAAIALFLPYCQLHKGNVIVDVFTEAAPPAVKKWLDILASLGVGLVAAVLAWRMGIGGFELRAANDESMVLRLPTWIGFVVVVPSFILLAFSSLIAAWRDATDGHAAGAAKVIE